MNPDTPIGGWTVTASSTAVVVSATNVLFRKHYKSAPGARRAAAAIRKTLRAIIAGTGGQTEQERAFHARYALAGYVKAWAAR